MVLPTALHSFLATQLPWGQRTQQRNPLPTMPHSQPVQDCFTRFAGWTRKTNPLEHDPSFLMTMGTTHHFANPTDVSNLAPLNPNPGGTSGLVNQTYNNLFGGFDAPGFQVIDIPLHLLGDGPVAATDSDELDQRHERGATFAHNIMKQLLPLMAQRNPELLIGPGSLEENLADYKANPPHKNYTAANNSTNGLAPHWDLTTCLVVGLVYQQDVTRQGGDSIISDLRQYVRDQYPDKGHYFGGISQSRGLYPIKDALKQDYGITIKLPADRVRIVLVNNRPHATQGGLLHGVSIGNGAGVRRFSRLDISNTRYSRLFDGERGEAGYEWMWKHPFVTPDFKPFLIRELTEATDEFNWYQSSGGKQTPTIQKIASFYLAAEGQFIPSETIVADSASYSQDHGSDSEASNL